MNDDFITIEQASKLLEVSTATIRRRIKKGEIKATKQDGPYGEQYYIPSNEIKTAQEIMEVIPVERKFDAQDLAEFIKSAIQEENKELHQEIQNLRNELAEMHKLLETKNSWWKRLFK